MLSMVLILALRFLRSHSLDTNMEKEPARFLFLVVNDRFWRPTGSGVIPLK
jgi:hypothetical protein